MSAEGHPAETPPQSAFFRATESARYQRQEGIRDYENACGRSLVIFWGPIHQPVITPFADAVNDIPIHRPLDLMLTSLGGDGEAAIRMAAMCHADRDDFRVIVPDTAASAATLLALAAESIVMSDTSALGPVDPQVFLPARKGFFPAKDILKIVDDLDQRTKENPHAFELYSALLADVDAILYQTAKAAIERTGELVPEVLRLRRPPPDDATIKEITKNLQSSPMHSATIGHARASDLGLPAIYMRSRSNEWDMLWRLHAHYVFHLGPSPRTNLIEGRRVSFTLGPSGVS
jgi:hypothetical protein